LQLQPQLCLISDQQATADDARYRITAKIASVQMRRFNLCADYFRGRDASPYRENGRPTVKLALLTRKRPCGVTACPLFLETPAHRNHCAQQVAGRASGLRHAFADAQPARLRVRRPKILLPGSRYRRVPFVVGVGARSVGHALFWGEPLEQRRGNVASVSALSRRAFLKGAAVMATTCQEVHRCRDRRMGHVEKYLPVSDCSRLVRPQVRADIQ
jgi:hypothetical protein